MFVVSGFLVCGVSIFKHVKTDCIYTSCYKNDPIFWNQCVKSVLFNIFYFIFLNPSLTFNIISLASNINITADAGNISV